MIQHPWILNLFARIVQGPTGDVEPPLEPDEDWDRWYKTSKLRERCLMGQRNDAWEKANYATSLEQRSFWHAEEQRFSDLLDELLYDRAHGRGGAE